VHCPFLYSLMRVCERVYAATRQRAARAGEGALLRRLCERVMPSWVPFAWIFSLIHFYSSVLRAHGSISYLGVPRVCIFSPFPFSFFFWIARACGSKSCVGVSLVCFDDFLFLFSLLHCTCMREHMVPRGASRLNFSFPHSPFCTYAGIWHLGVSLSLALFCAFLCGHACLRVLVCSCVRTRCVSRVVFGTASMRGVLHVRCVHVHYIYTYCTYTLVPFLCVWTYQHWLVAALVPARMLTHVFHVCICNVYIQISICNARMFCTYVYVMYTYK
jgi:hypothetical protein